MTYVVARLAGLADADARTVAHAAQYVDDATTDGPLTVTLADCPGAKGETVTHTFG